MKSKTWQASRHPPSAIQVLLGVSLTGYLIIIAFDSAYRLGTAVYSKQVLCVVYLTARDRTFTKDLYSGNQKHWNLGMKLKLALHHSSH